MEILINSWSNAGEKWECLLSLVMLTVLSKQGLDRILHNLTYRFFSFSVLNWVACSVIQGIPFYWGILVFITSACWSVVQISCHNIVSAISLESSVRVPSSCGVNWWQQSKKLSWPCHSWTFPLRKMCLFRTSWDLQKMGLHLGLAQWCIKSLAWHGKVLRAPTPPWQQAGAPSDLQPVKPSHISQIFCQSVGAKFHRPWFRCCTLCLSLINRIYISKRVEYYSQPSFGVE